MRCPACNYNHENEGDLYGCPNCEGIPMPKTSSERKQESRQRKLDAGLVRLDKGLPEWVTPQEKEALKALLDKMRKVK